MVEPLRQSDPSQQLASASLCPGRALQFGGNEDVLECREGRQELEILENKTHLLVADSSATIFVECPKIVARQSHHTARRAVEACAQSQEGRFTGTAGANDGAGLARQQAQVHLIQHGQSTTVTGRVNLAQVADFEDGLGHGVSEAERRFQGEPMVPRSARMLKAGFSVPGVP